MFSRIFFSSSSLRKRNIDINENKWRIIRSEKPRQISNRTRGKWQKLVNFPIASTEILESTILPAPKADNARWKKRGNEVLTRSTGGCASHVENDKWGISIPRIPEEEDSVSKDVFVCLFIYLCNELKHRHQSRLLVSSIFSSSFFPPRKFVQRWRVRALIANSLTRILLHFILQLLQRVVKKLDTVGDKAARTRFQSSRDGLLNAFRKFIRACSHWERH